MKKVNIRYGTKNCDLSNFFSKISNEVKELVEENYPDVSVNQEDYAKKLVVQDSSLIVKQSDCGFDISSTKEFANVIFAGLKDNYISEDEIDIQIIEQLPEDSEEIVND